MLNKRLNLQINWRSLLLLTGLLVTNPRTSVEGITFQPPEDDTPNDASSSASRGGELCQHQDFGELSASYVTPLIPPSGYGRTVESHPTILLHSSAVESGQALFSIKTSTRETHYQTLVPLPPQSGLIQIKLPADAPELKIGEVYHWYFSIECPDSVQPRYPVQGKIARISPSSSTRSSDQSDPLSIAEYYAQTGIWYDASAILYNLYASEPTNTEFQRHWLEFLESAGLTLSSKNEPAIVP